MKRDLEKKTINNVSSENFIEVCAYCLTKYENKMIKIELCGFKMMKILQSAGEPFQSIDQKIDGNPKM